MQENESRVIFLTGSSFSAVNQSLKDQIMEKINYEQSSEEEVLIQQRIKNKR